MLTKPIYKTLLIILVLAVCFVCAYIKDASAVEYGQLGGKIYGMPWKMKSVVLKNKAIDGVETLILEFTDRDILDSEICAGDISEVNKLLIQIPLSYQNGLKMPDFESALIRTSESSEMNAINGFHRVELNVGELNSRGRANVSGRLQLVSEKTKTELAGFFKARVCH